jgi:hypothetical protein
LGSYRAVVVYKKTIEAEPDLPVLRPGGALVAAFAIAAVVAETYASWWETGSGSRTRTYDPRINSPLLYRLSYAGVLGERATQNIKRVSPRQGWQAGKPGSAGTYFASASLRRKSISAASTYSMSSTPASPATIAEQRRVCPAR